MTVASNAPRCVLAGLLVPLAPIALHAQAYRAKAVRLVIPFAPGGNTDIIGRAYGALVKALNDPGVKDNLARQGAERVANTPEQHDAFNNAEIANWIKVAREAGIQPEWRPRRMGRDW